MRIDQWLFVKGLARSRTHAEDMIRRGDVSVMTSKGWESVTKAAYKIDEAFPLENIKIESELTKYVSRGGLKLEKALLHLKLTPQNLKVLDVGQSTGGFTDCLLQAGASEVIGVEVGRDQLDGKIKADQRNITFEGLDIRQAHLNEVFMRLTPFDLVVIDASFISLHHILPSVLELIAPQGQVLALVKPQFELTAKDLNKKGIVKSAAKLELVQNLIRDYVRGLSGVKELDYFQSEEKGKDGNVEYFIFLEKQS